MVLDGKCTQDGRQSCSRRALRSGAALPETAGFGSLPTLRQVAGKADQVDGWRGVLKGGGFMTLMTYDWTSVIGSEDRLGVRLSL